MKVRLLNAVAAPVLSAIEASDGICDFYKTSGRLKNKTPQSAGFTVFF
ncbi:hypothetical protein [Neisseria chenwenguii]|nr:hypothetical protein [Neisseria chenwenguii]